MTEEELKIKQKKQVLEGYAIERERLKALGELKPIPSPCPRNFSNHDSRLIRNVRKTTMHYEAEILQRDKFYLGQF